MAGFSPQEIEAAVRSLVSAERINLGIEVSTPVAYPGGDLVNVLVEDINGEIVVHDSGLAAMRLAEVGVTINRHTAARLAEYANRFNCEFHGSRVVAKSGAPSIEYAVAMVANASRSVADYALEIRRHAETDFRAVVADALREIVGKRLRENEEFRGKSGRHYRVSAVIMDEFVDGPACFIAPIANRAAVSHGFAMLYDLKQQYSETANDAVYDETGDLRDEDRLLLKSVGDVLTLEEAQNHYRNLMGVPLGNG